MAAILFFIFYPLFAIYQPGKHQKWIRHAQNMIKMLFADFNSKTLLEL